MDARPIRLATTFSGIGAIEHALERMGIGYDIVFASDSDKFVKESYFANYPIDPDNWYDDVRDIKGGKYRYKIDLLVGGSPCQPFSMVGNRAGLKDIRGTLIYEFIRLIGESRPRAFIFENVKGLLNQNNGKTWKIVRSRFLDLGYTVYSTTMNAKDYGIPQNRERLFVIGFRGKRRDFEFPGPKPLKLKMRDVLEKKPDSKYLLPTKGIRFAKKIRNIRKKNTQIDGRIALCQKANQQFNWHGDFVTVHQGENKTRQSSEHCNTTSIEEWILGRPIPKGSLRKLTPRECMRLMGFDDSYRIVVGDMHAYRQSGNSIAVNVLIELLKKIDPNWLRR